MVLDTKQKIVVHYIADGEVQEFNFNFQIFEAGDLDVYLDETLTDSGYNVTINENSYGGKVVFAEPPSNGTRITIIRNLEIKRTSDFQEGGAFRAKVINHELDYQVATLEQLDEKIGRSMIYPPYAQEGVSTSLPLPSAGKALVWNQEASALTNSLINPDNLIVEASSAKDIAQNCALQAQNSAASAQAAEIQAQTSAQSAVEAAETAQIAAAKASFGNIGDIQYTARTDAPNGGVWCNGAEYTKEMFPDVYQMLVDEKLQSTTIDDFDSMVSAQGYCELFALDISSQTFKVPKLLDKYIIDFNSTLPVKGNGLSIGLTDGTYNYTLMGSNASYMNAGTNGFGAGVGTHYANVGTSTKNYNIIGVTPNPDYSGIITDASTASKFVTLKAYVVLYSSVAEASIIVTNEILNNRADVDFANITHTAKNLIADLSMPSDTYIDLSAANNNTYTAPAAGIYWVLGYMTSASHFLKLTNQNTGMVDVCYRGYENNVSLTASVAVKKGDVVQLSYSVSSINSFKFIYAEGGKE